MDSGRPRRAAVKHKQLNSCWFRVLGSFWITSTWSLKNVLTQMSDMLLPLKVCA